MRLDADVAVPARDRKRVERLCRYILRPAVTLERLEALPDEMLSYRLENRWRESTAHILTERRVRSNVWRRRSHHLVRIRGDTTAPRHPGATRVGAEQGRARQRSGRWCEGRERRGKKRRGGRFIRIDDQGRR